MLLIMYKIFSSLLGHLPFSVQFFLHFYGATFFGTPNNFTVLHGTHCGRIVAAWSTASRTWRKKLADLKKR